MSDLDVKIQWHAPDACYAAVFMREGEPWYLGGALVGMGSNPGRAVMELCELAEQLVVHGENFLTDDPLSVPDRRWLFEMLDRGSAREHEMFVALKEAER
jgi:hypothetical protein